MGLLPWPFWVISPPLAAASEYLAYKLTGTSPGEVSDKWPHYKVPEGTDGGTAADAERARYQLAALLGGALVVTAAPAMYAAAISGKGKRKRKLTDKEAMLGKSIENASQQATGVLMTALASPAISAVASYLIIQKLEDGRLISKGLGDAAQTLLTVSAAGPAIQGIGGMVTSAFKGMK